LPNYSNFEISGNEQQVHLKAITKTYTHAEQKASKKSDRDVKQVLVGIRKRNPQNSDGTGEPRRCCCVVLSWGLGGFSWFSWF